MNVFVYFRSLVIIILFQLIIIPLYASDNIEIKKEYYDRNNNMTNDETQINYFEKGQLIRKQILCDNNEDNKIETEVNIYYKNGKKSLFDLHDYSFNKRSYMFYNDGVLTMMLTPADNENELYIFFSSDGNEVLSVYEGKKDGSMLPLRKDQIDKVRKNIGYDQEKSENQGHVSSCRGKKRIEQSGARLNK